MFLAVFAVGVFFSWWTVLRTGQEMRANLLQQTRMVAHAVNVPSIQRLSGTDADIENADYQHIKEQLTSVRLSNPKGRFVYLLGRGADGAAFFFVDSEPSDSEDYSPPGQIYEDASEDILGMFDIGGEVVEGPLPDQWGTWISALIPITDPQTGSVIAVLGMDIDASDWSWNVASRSALPMGLIIMLFITVGTVLAATTRCVEASPQPVLRRLLPPLMAIVVLVLTGTGALLWKQHQEHINYNVTAKVEEKISNLHFSLDQQAGDMIAVTGPMAANALVQKALRENDSASLQAAWQPVFEIMGQNSKLAHFSFLDKNRVCFLSIDAPEKCGNIVNRFIAIKAEQTGEVVSGMELGPLGTFTLSVVQPVFEGGKLLGYVELGKEIEDVLQRQRSDSGSHLAISIRKENIDRKTWEDGMRTLGRDADWDRLPGSVIIYTSQGRLPDILASWVDHVSGNLSSNGSSMEIALDGRVWRVSVMPMQDASGKEVGALMDMQDITAEKAAFEQLLTIGEMIYAVLLTFLLGFVFVLLRRTDASIRIQQSKLRASEEKFRLLVQNSHDVIYTLDVNGVFTFLSPSFNTLLGYPIEQAIGKSALSFVHPDDRSRCADFIRISVEKGEVPGAIEYRMRHTDGSWRWHSSNGTGIRDEAGALVGFQAIARDITERKRAEEELQETNRLLEEATVRSQALAEEAASANASKSEFLAHMSHEFRTPLNAIIGFSEIIKNGMMGPVSKKYAEYAGDIYGSGVHLLSLINDVLDMSKIEAKQLVLKRIPLDVSQIIEECVKMTAVRFQDRKQEITVDVPENLPLVSADERAIRQVFLNLLSNANKYTGDGGRISITAAYDAPEKTVHMDVKDNGIGIADELQVLVFEPFHQSGTMLAREKDGTGLGLSISRKLVELHGGHLTLSSRIGIGTTIRIVLPVEAPNEVSHPQIADIPETTK
ncbi:MAG: hypothetical protein A2018_04310 [Alphaproteobacteria bacterium GWF2_58_20]|nr:MAG: hypothetical protein A2018_04310 [Alphaproteobacteria bacterium GWF2_58_20]